MSLPLRECGLKLATIVIAPLAIYVTPLAGVWIEILGAVGNYGLSNVTPLAGVWIEIFHGHGKRARKCRHSPCGSVD